MDLDDTYICYWYWWDVEVDPRSRSQGQRSRSYRHLCEKIGLTITHERIDESCLNFLWGSVILRVKALHQIFCVVTRPSAAYNACTRQMFFAHKSWTDGQILMILTYIIDIDRTLKLTQGQAYRVKGQRSRSYWRLCKKIVLTITHERIDGSCWNFLWGSVLLRVKGFY